MQTYRIKPSKEVAESLICYFAGEISAICTKKPFLLEDVKEIKRLLGLVRMLKAAH
jgi:hypothetical protein